MRMRGIVAAITTTALAVGIPQAAHAADSDTQAPVVSLLGLPDTYLRADVIATTVVSDDIGVTRTELLADGVLVGAAVGQGTTWQWWDTKTVPDGPVTLTVRAYDAVGNVGERSGGYVVDNTKPTATFAVAEHNGNVHGNVPVTVTGAHDPTNVYSIDIGRQSSYYPAKAGPWVVRVDTGKSIDMADLFLRVNVRDRAGNEVQYYRELRVDQSAPYVNVSKAPAAYARGPVSFDVQTFDWSDATIELLANGKSVAVRKTAAGKDATMRLAWNPAGKNGKYTFTVRAKDWFGQTRQIARTVTLDTKAPSLSITKAPGNKAKVKGKVTIKAKAADTYGVSRVELLVNGKVVARDYQSGYAFTLNTAKQKKTFKVRLRAYDRAGNVKYTPVRTWHR
ncbi:Ig-like domain-containing protein [Actinoplanes sp. RD1]|uniref:Ig-like domain-containing protein n=1 Tax=Actinoplanes sp. RD1 TaxID=3064538 RepID=UPI0027429A3D|nr:Ig-like domain-containing protein [Actinoplanes sp. RD1]